MRIDVLLRHGVLRKFTGITTINLIFFYVLLTVHLSIILVIKQLDAQIFVL